jgi:hypothetical protein
MILEMTRGRRHKRSWLGESRINCSRPEGGPLYNRSAGSSSYVEKMSAGLHGGFIITSAAIAGRACDVLARVVEMY